MMESNTLPAGDEIEVMPHATQIVRAPVQDLMLTPVFDLETAQKRLAELQRFVEFYMIEGEDFGKIPGTPKPTLYKSGADKLCDIYALADTYKLTNRTEDWDRNLFDYEVECTLLSKRTGQLVASGLGSCNSYEGKYRWRETKRKCPQCGKETIIKGKEEYGGGWLCWRKEGKSDGCGAKFTIGDSSIMDQVVGKTQNDDIPTLKNTILKMAKKRCLGSNTPILVATKCGPSRVRMDTVYQMWSKNHGAIRIPTIHGWADIKGFSREEREQSVRIDLLDGSHIQCSGEHVFPTQRGELSVADLQIGDSLIRAKLELPCTGTVDSEIGWVAGFFIAEGHVDRGGVKFTMHAGETEESLRIIRLGESFGCSCDFQLRNKGLAADLTVRGSAFVGLMKQFVSGDDCYGKHLSKYSWRQGEIFLRAILDGYLAGDGHKLERHGRVEQKWILGFTGQNFALADDLRCMAACLGYRLNLDHGWSSIGDKRYPTYTGWVGTTEPRYNGINLSEIVRITVENRKSVLYDLEIDAPHLFLLPHGIVSHNSKVDAVLSATRSSGLFTQDMDDIGQAVDAQEQTANPAPPVKQAAPIKESPKEPPNVYLEPGKQGFCTITGEGLAVILSKLYETEKTLLGLAYDGNFWTVPIANAFRFADACVKHGVGVVHMDSGAARTSAPNGRVHPEPVHREGGAQPSPASPSKFKVIKGVFAKSGQYGPKSPKSGQKWELRQVVWGDSRYATFNKDLWPLLEAGKGKPAVLSVVEPVEKGKDGMIDGILRIGETEYEVIEGKTVAVLQRS